MWKDAHKEYPKGQAETYLVWDGEEWLTAWPDSHSRHGWRDLIGGAEIVGVMAYTSISDLLSKTGWAEFLKQTIKEREK